MAFFEYLLNMYNDTVSMIKPVGGRGIGGFYPSPIAYSEGPDNYKAGPLHIDSAGNLVTRSVSFTDEMSWRRDFRYYNTALTGTLSFTSGSNTVTGVGTSFTTELNKECYIKLTAHPNTAYRKVMDVVSDTEVELSEDYPTTGSGASIKNFTVPTIGGNGTITVANSEMTIASGTTNGARTYSSNAVDYCPLMMHSYLRLSQRIANQEFYIGFVDDVANPSVYALIVFSGTDNTIISLRTASAGDASNTETSVVSMPSGFVTSNKTLYQLSIMPEYVFLTVRGKKVVSHQLHIPRPYESLTWVAGWYNTGTPSSSSSAIIDSVYIGNHNQIEITNSFDGDTIPVSIEEDINTVSGTLTTASTAADQVIISYTVPTGKALYVAGYNISNGIGTVDGNPVKIGKGAMTETSSPGSVNGLVLRSMYMNSQIVVTENFSVPRYLAAEGETVKITTTPTATNNTVWKASLDFILR